MLTSATMKITLVIIAVVMLLTDVCADIQPKKNFDLNRFAGRWYRVGLAYSSPGFAKYRSKLTVAMGTVEPKENGDADMTLWDTQLSDCKSKVYTYRRTAVPGVFTYFSSRHNKVKDITVVETNYIEYALIFKYKKFNKEYSQVSLYGRTQKLRPELIERFKTFAKQHRFPEEAILTPPPADNCPPTGY
ncbi:neutrophil gelatinase-associated lipocalin [Brachyhypopomus gauderio]|uniref:neutrophil gelatinase-associated lipocalin n=1 Tax=Brachyhypopomus gauderio TaxID=698409 RepID=UPI004041AB8C